MKHKDYPVGYRVVEPINLFSMDGDSIFKELLEILMKDKYTPWKWESYTPYNDLEEHTSTTLF